MAEIKTMRATARQMREAAENLAYIFGSNAKGNLVPMGQWPWWMERATRDGIDVKVPDLPPMPPNPSPRQRRDQRYATGLLLTAPRDLLDALLTCRRIMAECVEGAEDLREEGYSAKAYEAAAIRLGERLLTRVQGTIGKAANVEARMSEVRRDLAREKFETGDVDKYLAGLDLRLDEPDESERDPAGETLVAVQTAIFDCEIAKSLKPLTPADRTLILDNRKLPTQLDDPRVLAAVFRVPGVMLPFDDDELRGIAKLAFFKNWPRTSSAFELLNEMIAQVRPVAGHALLMLGELATPTNPYDIFRRIPGGKWALAPLVDRHPPQAGNVFADLSNGA